MHVVDNSSFYLYLLVSHYYQNFAFDRLPSETLSPLCRCSRLHSLGICPAAVAAAPPPGPDDDDFVIKAAFLHSSLEA